MSKENTAKNETLQQADAVSETDNEKKAKPRVISNPNEVASLVLMQIDNVSTKKDELTIAIKGLSDVSKQLVRAYGENIKVIASMQHRIKELEDKQQAE